MGPACWGLAGLFWEQTHNAIPNTLIGENTPIALVIVTKLGKKQQEFDARNKVGISVGNSQYMNGGIQIYFPSYKKNIIVDRNNVSLSNCLPKQIVSTYKQLINNMPNIININNEKILI